VKGARYKRRHGVSTRKLARMMGVSQARVQQIEARALGKLKKNAILKQFVAPKARGALR
jgi:DNA-directed RNA polymerase sigma subunit (sigma70/sigma32)